MASKKISICYIIDALSGGGAQTHLLNVLRNMNYDRYSISLVCVRFKGYRFDTIQDLPVKTHVCNLPNIMNPFRTLVELWRVRRFLVLNKVHIVQSYMFNPNLFAGMLRLSKPGIFLITTRRDMGYWHKRRHWLAYRFLNYITHRVIAVSKQVERSAITRESLNPSKVVTIYNGLDLDRFDPQNVSVAQELVVSDSFTVGMLAILRPEKRHDLLIQAASKIIQKIPNTRFVLAGAGAEYQEVVESINQQLEEAGLKKYFLLLGRRLDVPEVIASFNVSVLCSDSEGMSNTLLESIAMGTPVVATDVGGNPEVIQQGINGFLVPKGDSDAIAERIIELALKPEVRETMSKNARRIAEEKFDIRNVISEFEKLYSNVN